MTLTAAHPTWRTDPQLRSIAEATVALLGDHATVTNVAAPGFSGRNGAWVMTLDSGRRVFVKQISLVKAGEAAFTRSLAYATFAAEHPRFAAPGPRLLAHCSRRQLLVFEYCSGSSLAQLLVDEKVPHSFSTTAGRLLARLHSGPTSGLLPTNPPSPPVAMFHGVAHHRYAELTLGELRLWPTLQQDAELVEAVSQLRTVEDSHRTAPIHGDLRLDQFHIDGDELSLLDWEEFGQGDPARDLGTLAGEWIYRAVLDTVTSRAGAGSPPDRFDTASATRRITERMTHLVPQIRRLWTAYRSETATTDEGLATRATAHLGWHLIDRTVTRASFVAQLPGIERAAAGIGRRILLHPDRYAIALGIEESVA